MPSASRSARARRWLGLSALGAAFVFITVSGMAGIDGGPSGKVLKGTEGRDVLNGTPRADRIYGYGGNDTIRGNSGGDSIFGGRGRDVLYGGDGNDRVVANDREADRISCGRGRDSVVVDPVDRLASRECEQVRVVTPPNPTPPPPQSSVVLDNQPFVCSGPVDIDLVKVTMPTEVEDAIRLDENCTGRIGRVEVDTWTADGIKVQNRRTVARDLVIESGYIKCHAVYGDYHQDGIQVMGGFGLTFRNLAIDCLGNANVFVAVGGAGSSIPTDAVCERCVLGPNAGQTLFVASSVRSGARDSTICAGRFRAIRVAPEAVAMVDVGNVVLPVGDPACVDVTGRGSGSGS